MILCAGTFGRLSNIRKYILLLAFWIRSSIVKRLDEVCVSHTKQIGDNKTVCTSSTTQEVCKNAAHWFYPFKNINI